METNERELKTLLAKGETLTVEFKSDAKGLPDRELVAAVVALANTEGGVLLLGVEDDGTVTGIQPNHQDTAGLSALIANRTNPPTAVGTEVITWDDKKILSIHVSKTRGIVSTTDGLLLRRRLLASGRPEA
ncbi:MAG: ATP-binding protein, partial [Smithellaceae bacterium]|nr:ATP-binding protein [Smithellaceae bacterium]